MEIVNGRYAGHTKDRGGRSQDTSDKVRLVFEVDSSLADSVGRGFVASAWEEKVNEFNTLLHKQADYGSKNISACPVGPIPGIVVRLFDKISRLANLTRSGASAKNESLEDTTLDIANYGTIASMVLKGTWPE